MAFTEYYIQSVSAVFGTMHKTNGGELTLNKIQYMPDNPIYGIAYVPYSKFENLYPVCDALKRGTIFKVLDIPFSSYSNIDIMNPFRSK